MFGDCKHRRFTSYKIAALRAIVGLLWNPVDTGIIL